MSPQAWSLAIAVTLTACASTPPAIGTRDLLDPVKPGAPRTEVVSRLGPPYAMFEGERVMIWSIGQDAGGYFVGAGRSTRHDLVVVFDNDGRVARHGLVEVHKPQ